VRTAARLVLLLAFGCSQAPVGAAPSKAPAKVEGAVPEAQVPVVTLTADAERRIALTVAAVTEREVTRRRAFPGVVSIAAGRRSRVVAPLAGRLELPDPKKPIVAGADVSEGQALWRLVLLQPDQVLQRSIANRDLATAQAAFDAATVRQRRAEQLKADQSGSQRAVEDATLAVATATASLADAKLRIATWDGSLLRADGTIVLTSPLSGVVLECEAVSGQVVREGALLAEVASFDPLWIHVAVHAAEVADVDTRAPAQIRGLGELDSASWSEAPVAAAPPVAAAASGSVDLVYELSGKRPLRPGQRVLAMVVARGSSKRLVVPHAAVVRDAYGGSWVYVRRQDREYVRQRVEVAWVEGGEAVLGEGPAPGAEVVTSGTAELFGAEFGQGK